MWLYYFLALALIIGFHNGITNAEEVKRVRPSYADAMRDLMASSRARVTLAPWTYKGSDDVAYGKDASNSFEEGYEDISDESEVGETQEEADEDNSNKDDDNDSYEERDEGSDEYHD